MALWLRWLAAGLVFVMPGAAQVNVLTYHNDNARTGQNLNEPLLSPASVGPSQFGRRFSQSVDSSVYAQPLYMAAVPLARGGVHNLVLVATSHNSLYAFDADDNAGSDSAPLWQVSFINPAQGVTSIPWQDVNCPVIYPEIGITGTPVIDPATYTIYFVASTKEPAGSGTFRYVHRMHALDVRSGAELPASPVEIQASVPGLGDGGGTVNFVPVNYKPRSALLLANGVVYTSWSSHCDLGHYHGWIMGYKADTLEQVAVFNDTPNGAGASFWGAGAGPASDGDGNVFAVSANGSFDQDNAAPDLGDSIIKLSPRYGLTVADYFTPFNQSYLSGSDLDLGSSGPILLPPEVGSGTHPNLVAAAGKEGRIYLVDRDLMGGYRPLSDAAAVQTVDLGLQVFGPPAYFAGALYFAPAMDQVRAFHIAGAALSPGPVSSSTMTIPSPGATPSVSANGNTNGVVWIAELGDGAGTLHAFDAADLSHELYHDELGSYIPFSVPTIADGKVYVGTLDSLVAYSLFPAAPGLIGGVANAASFNSAIAPGSLIAIFGSGLVRATVAAQQIPLPVSLADTTVSINGLRAALLYVSPGQINAQVPAQTVPGPATMTVSSSGAATAAVTFQVSAVAPQIFVAGNGRLLALNHDGTVNTPSNPAAAGTAVTVFLTGQAAMTSPSATIGGMSASLTYAGAAPGTVGVAQMNMRVPALPPGDYPLQVSMGGVQSNTGLISVH